MYAFRVRVLSTSRVRVAVISPGPIRIRRARNIERTGIVGEAVVMRFVCDERDRGCDEGREREEGGGEEKRETRSSFKLASAESRQRGSAVEESETRAAYVRIQAEEGKEAESSSNPRRVYTPLAKFRRPSSRNDCLQ